MSSFFESFLKISSINTLLTIVIWLMLSFPIWYFSVKNKKWSFSTRMIYSTIIGIIFGFIILMMAGFPQTTTNIKWINQEVSIWLFSLGNIFISLLKFLVVPLVFLSLSKVIIDYGKKENISKVLSIGILTLLSTTIISSLIGILMAIITNVGSGLDPNSFNTADALNQVSEKQSNFQGLPKLIESFIPGDFVTIFSYENIVGVIIIAIMLSFATLRMSKKNEKVNLIIDIINGLNSIVTSMIMNILKLMPYATILLIAANIAMSGMIIFKEGFNLLITIWAALIIMLIIHIVLIFIFAKVSPKEYLSKSKEVLIAGFATRSSMSVLPLIINTIKDFKIKGSVSSLVPTLSTQMGMNGCSGIYPAIIAVTLAHMNNQVIDLTFILTLVLAITIGSMGLPGMPGTATTALVVTLTIIGLTPQTIAIGISLSVGIDALVDMGRTAINISGGITSTILTNKAINK